MRLRQGGASFVHPAPSLRPRAHGRVSMIVRQCRWSLGGGRQAYPTSRFTLTVHRQYLMIHKSRDRFSRLGSPSNPSIDHLRQPQLPSARLAWLPRHMGGSLDRHFPEARVIPHTLMDSNGPKIYCSALSRSLCWRRTAQSSRRRIFSASLQGPWCLSNPDVVPTSRLK